MVQGSPRSLKRKMNQLTDNLVTATKKLKYKTQRVKVLQKRVSSLTAVVNTLKKQDLISSNCETILRSTFSDVPLAVMQRILRQKSKKVSRVSFPVELRSFALTLSFYSMKAYNFVRKTFNLALPHPTTIRQWYSSIDGQPGFTSEALSALTARVSEAAKNQKEIHCSLMMDEMAIRKHIEWDGKRFIGYVDVGTGVDDDTTPVATEALVFMVVSLSAHWKVPIGYFLIQGLSGEERANLVQQALHKLHDIGVQVSTLTCDGPACNFAMLQALGADLKPPDVKPYFDHPANATIKVHVVLDACHMLKLLRNTLASYGILLDGDKNKVTWIYIEALHKLQEREGLRLANKLKSSHLMWIKQKMKVNLAAQTLSASVADALEFCCHDLKLPQFQGCEATVKFIRITDRLFDILNSRNPLAKGYKAPLRLSNEFPVLPFLNEAKLYISNLCNDKGIPMYSTKRKTAFVGLVCDITSVIAAYSALVKSVPATLSYLLTYKLSQDHLELFFGAVRASLGSNNNPTVRQFIAAYKRLLMRHNVESGHGNVSSQDSTAMLAVSLDSIIVDNLQTDTLDMSVARRYDIDLRQPRQEDHDYVDMPNYGRLSEFKFGLITYIAGYVVRMVTPKIHCPECVAALTDDVPTDTVGAQFMRLKNRGGLVKASVSVVDVCEETEKCFQRMHNVTKGQLPRAAQIVPAIASSVLAEVGIRSFVTLHNHMFDSTPDSNHIFNLIKCVSQSYCQIRMHHLAKQQTAAITGIKVRKELTKLVLFKHQ